MTPKEELALLRRHRADLAAAKARLEADPTPENIEEMVRAQNRLDIVEDEICGLKGPDLLGQKSEIFPKVSRQNAE